MQITEFSVCVLKKNQLISFTVIIGERLHGVPQTLPREGEGRNISHCPRDLPQTLIPTLFAQFV